MQIKLINFVNAYIYYSYKKFDESDYPIID